MPVQNGGYFSRSLALLRRDQGWIKPLLVLSAASLVPVVGFLGMQGYALEWARLTAWGVDSSPKQKDVRIGECIKSGWRGFLGGVGYVLISVLVIQLALALFGDGFIYSIVGLVANVVASVFYLVGALRATIYQDAKAGYQFDRIWEMITRDTDGIARVYLVDFCIALCATLAITLIATITFVPMLVSWALGVDSSALYVLEGEYVDPTTMRYIFFNFLDALVRFAPWLAIISFLVAVATTFNRLIVFTATGLWMRNFDVPSWGASADPLPNSGYVAQQNYGQAPYGQPGAGDAYQQPYQAGEQYQAPEQAYQPYVQNDPYVDSQTQQPYGQQMTPDQQLYTQIDEAPYTAEGDYPSGSIQDMPWQAGPVSQGEAQAADAQAMADAQPMPAVTPIVLPPIDQADAQGQAAEQGQADAQTPAANPYGREVIEVINLTDPQPVEEEVQPEVEAAAIDEQVVATEQPADQAEAEQPAVDEQPAAAPAEEPQLDDEAGLHVYPEPVRIDEILDGTFWGEHASTEPEADEAADDQPSDQDPNDTGVL